MERLDLDYVNANFIPGLIRKGERFLSQGIFPQEIIEEYLKKKNGWRLIQVVPLYKPIIDKGLIIYGFDYYWDDS